MKKVPRFGKSFFFEEKQPNRGNMNLSLILTQFRKSFPVQWINALAKQASLIKRSTSKCDGSDICLLLLQAANAPTELSLSSCCKMLHQIKKTAKLRIQSLWERIVKPSTVEFMERIYAKTWEIYVNKFKDINRKLPCDFFKNFSQVLIEDSSIVTLNEKLSESFQGNGGTGSKSSLKIHLAFDALSGKFKWLNIHKDKSSDLSLAQDILPQVTERTLLIRDLGFFVINAFRKIMENNAWFLSRLHPSVNVYLNANDLEPLDLVKYLKTKYKSFSRGSLQVYIGGKERLPVRLVFYQAPAEVVNQRKRKIRRNEQKRGSTASDGLLKWQEYTLLITNVTEEMMPTDFIGTVYRLRWDVELIFKTWKSHLRLDVLKGSRPERIEVFLYAKLIGVLLLGMMCGYLREVCSNMFSQREISEEKVAKFLISMNVFSGLFKGYLSKEQNEFLCDKYWLEEFCKQKRRRKTTLERINILESFGVAAF